MQNPLESYRRTQRELRRHFDAFTRDNCPTCPTPCCVRPARILPTDILLAEATGWHARVAASAAAPGVDETVSEPFSQTADQDMVAEVAARMANALHKAPETAEAEPGALPCEYLGQRGCTFPIDLRPFGCTTYICRYMYASLDRMEIARIKRLVRELEQKHTILLRTLRPIRRHKEDEE